MTFLRTRQGFALTALALAVAAAAPALAELATRAAESTPAAEAEAETGPVPVHTSPLRAQCWQEGVQIFDLAGLSGLALSAATRGDTVSFKREGETAASVFILPIADGLCLVRPEG